MAGLGDGTDGRRWFADRPNCVIINAPCTIAARARRNIAIIIMLGPGRKSDEKNPSHTTAAHAFKCVAGPINHHQDHVHACTHARRVCVRVRVCVCMCNARLANVCVCSRISISACCSASARVKLIEYARAGAFSTVYYPA